MSRRTERQESVLMFSAASDRRLPATLEQAVLELDCDRHASNGSCRTGWATQGRAVQRQIWQATRQTRTSKGRSTAACQDKGVATCYKVIAPDRLSGSQKYSNTWGSGSETSQYIKEPS